MAERKIIVSLTSYPPRIGGVHLVVDSLYKQTLQADEIVLYLSLEEFPSAEDNLPDTLRELIGKRGFKIVWVEGNLKSHKKYYYALQEYRDDIVITVDDDIIYAPSMISELFEGWKRFPYAVSARRTRIILRKGENIEEYNKWDMKLDEYVNTPRMDLCAIGFGGICYGPGCAHEKWFDKDLFMTISENQDDLWLKFNEIIQYIPVVYVDSLNKDIADITIEHSQECSLAKRNVHRHENDYCIGQIVELMKTNYLGYYMPWFDKLMEHAEYMICKKDYYRDTIKKSLDQMGGIPIYFYGAGQRAKFLLRILSDLQLTNQMECVIVSEMGRNPSEIEGLKVRQLAEINRDRRIGIIFGVNEENQCEIERKLKKYDYQCIELNVQKLIQYNRIRMLEMKEK